MDHAGDMTNSLQRMAADGHRIDAEVLASISPYQTEHINRFGNYELNTNQEVEPLEPVMSISLLNDVRTPLAF